MIRPRQQFKKATHMHCKNRIIISGLRIMLITSSGLHALIGNANGDSVANIIDALLTA